MRIITNLGGSLFYAWQKKLNIKSICLRVLRKFIKVLFISCYTIKNHFIIRLTRYIFLKQTNWCIFNAPKKKGIFL